MSRVIRSHRRRKYQWLCLHRFMSLECAWIPCTRAPVVVIATHSKMKRTCAVNERWVKMTPTSIIGIINCSRTWVGWICWMCRNKWDVIREWSFIIGSGGLMGFHLQRSQRNWHKRAYKVLDIVYTLSNILCIYPVQDTEYIPCPGILYIYPVLDIVYISSPRILYIPWPRYCIYPVLDIVYTPS